MSDNNNKTPARANRFNQANRPNRKRFWNKPAQPITNNMPPVLPKENVPITNNMLPVVPKENVPNNGAYVPNNGVYVQNNGMYVPNNGIYVPNNGSHVPNNGVYLPVYGIPNNQNGNDSLIGMVNNLEYKLSKACYAIESLNKNINNLEWVLYNSLNDRDRKMQMIDNSLHELSSNYKLNESKKENPKKSRNNTTGAPIKRVMRVNKIQDKTQGSIINLPCGIPSDMIPMMIFGNMLGNSEEPNKKESSFEEIKIPDLEKNIRTTVELNRLDNFTELALKNLDEIANKGKEFIQLIEQHNIENKPIIAEPLNAEPLTAEHLNAEPLTSDALSDTTCEKHDNDLLEKTEQNFSETPLDGILKLIKLISAHDNKHSCGSLNEKKQSIDPNHLTINDVIKVDNDNLFSFFGKRYSIDPRKLMRLVRPIEMLNGMVGMKSVKKSVYNFVSHFLQNDHSTSMLNTAIYGKPGVGKTDLGKILCMIYSALEIVPSERFKLVRASDLIGKYVGETRQKTKKILDEAEGGVLFIDEAYSLMSGAGDRYSFGKECIDTLNQELSENRRKLVCIIAGYEQEIQKTFFGSNPGLDRRFPFRYTLKDYTDEQMKDIMIRMIRLENIMIDTRVNDNDIKTLFKDKRYFGNSGGDIENLLTKCKFANNIRSLGKHPMIRNVLTLSDFDEGLRIFKIHKKIDDSSIYKNMFI